MHEKVQQEIDRLNREIEAARKKKKKVEKAKESIARMESYHNPDYDMEVNVKKLSGSFTKISATFIVNLLSDRILEIVHNDLWNKKTSISQRDDDRWRIYVRGRW